MTLIHLENYGGHIGAGIWCGILFVIAGVLTIFSGSSSLSTLRRVMLVLSIIFALFFAFWTFIGAFPALFLNASIDVENDYNKNRWLRVTQGFCAIFEIILARVTLSQRTSDQPIVLAGPVLAQPNLPIYQPVVQTGYQPVYQQGVQPGVQPGVQNGVQFQALTYPPTAPPTYTE